MDRPAFRELQASLLRCPSCRDAVPVRKRLLLVLPQGEKYEYLCTRCGEVCGTTILAPERPHVLF